ncbi:MAG TPA: thymidylate synthase [Chloroflexi bacterium]|jgi:thymidylate synthase|nr:thymidylate synthase [Chloroflexota bacterium]
MALLLSEDSVDDLARELFDRILEFGESTSPTKGKADELRAVTLELRNPRARLSRTAQRGRLFSSLGELCWYLSGSDDVAAIAYYLAKYNDFAVDNRVPSAYGPRLFNFDGFNQLATIVDSLRKNQWTRKAVVQLFDHEDLALSGEVPCTCNLQFMLRQDALELIVFMRSNDAYIGLVHDVFAFTMIQELVACTIGVELGSYVHIVGSMHLYEVNRDNARTYLSEGWQSIAPMPAMPRTDPREGLDWLLEVEGRLRLAQDPLDVDLVGPDPYWSDLARLLAIFGLMKQKRVSDIKRLQPTLQSRAYDLYIAEKLAG